MSLVDVRSAIVATLAAALPAGTSVEAHRGRFDSAAEIQRFATKAPAVLVACVRSQVLNPGSGLLVVRASWALFVITRDRPQLPRDTGALALTEALLLTVGGNSWGRSDVGEPTDLEATNLYAGTVDNLGVALWAVTFEQLITDPVLDAATLTAMAGFVTFHEDIEMNPASGVIDITQTDTLPQ